MSPEIRQAPPKYLQIADHIREQVARGDLKPGDEVPSERQIVAEWGVSRPTATRALAALRAAGIVEARQGSGTFVAEQPALNRRARDRYTRTRQTGFTYTSSEHSVITDAEQTAAPDYVASALGIPSGAPAIRRRRVVFDEDGPVEVSTSWFDGSLAATAPGLLSNERIREGTMAYVESVTGRRAATARATISARLARPDEREDLRLAESHSAVVLVHHTVVDVNGDPLEFAEATYPPGRWIFEDSYDVPSA